MKTVTGKEKKMTAEILQAIKNADMYASQLHNQELRITAYLTRQNIQMVKENPEKHGNKFVEMYGDEKMLIKDVLSQ